MQKSSSANAWVTVNINRDEIMSALRQMTVDNENFNHRFWAIWDAETFETAAKMIREGYSDKSSPTSNLPGTHR